MEVSNSRILNSVQSELTETKAARAKEGKVESLSKEIFTQDVQPFSAIGRFAAKPMAQLKRTLGATAQRIEKSLARLGVFPTRMKVVGEGIRGTSEDKQLFARELTSKVMKQHLKEAKRSGKTVEITFRATTLVLTPKGKIYQHQGVVGQGAYKETAKMALVAAPLTTSIKQSSLQKAMAKTKTQEAANDPEVQNEVKLQKQLHALKKNGRPLGNVAVSKEVKVADSGQVALMSDFCSGGDVNKCLGPKKQPPLDAKQKAFVVAQMAKGLAELHDAGIVHRDLKPDNFLVVTDEKGNLSDVKLTDLGKSSSKDDRFVVTKLPLPWVAPELFKDPSGKSEGYFSNPADVYQLGVTAYMVMTGTPMDQLAFRMGSPDVRTNGQMDWNKFKNVRANPEEWPKFQEMPSPVQNFVKQMLSSDPAQRPSAAEVSAFFKELSRE